MAKPIEIVLSIIRQYNTTYISNIRTNCLPHVISTLKPLVCGLFSSLDSISLFLVMAQIPLPWLVSVPPSWRILVRLAAGTCCWYSISLLVLAVSTRSWLAHALGWHTLLVGTRSWHSLLALAIGTHSCIVPLFTSGRILRILEQLTRLH